MVVRLRAWLVLAVLSLCMASASAADLGKLDHHARRAYQSLSSTTVTQALVEDTGEERLEAASAAAPGHLDVILSGNVSRAALQAAGAIVRSSFPNGVHTAFLPVDRVPAVAALAGVRRIEGAVRCEPELNLSVPTTAASFQRGAGPGFTGLNGAGVLIGAIDRGIDPDHENFRTAGGLTRLVNIWDQTGGPGPPPAGFAYGTECTPAQINGGTCAQMDTDGHGSHVMGIAGGDGSASNASSAAAFTYVGMAPMADLLMVKSNLTTTEILDGVNYVFQRATALGKNAVCNLSLGTHFGPHDGTSTVESTLSSLTGPGRIIVKSAGNSGSSAVHAETFATLGGASVTMSVNNGLVTSRRFSVCGYYESTENMTVTVTTPNGTVVGPVALGGTNAAYPGTVTPNGAVYVENGVTLTSTGARQVIIDVLNQNAATQDLTGTWTYTFTAVTLGAANGEIDLWRYFRSSMDFSPDFVIGNDPNDEIITEPGNAVQAITVGSWTTRQSWLDCNAASVNFVGSVAAGNLTPFSSRGPTRDGRQKPEIAAPGSAIASARTLDVFASCPPPGTLSTLLPGLLHTMNQGTSMSAPHVAGAAALVMQKRGAMTPAQLKTFFASRAVTDGFTGTVWNKAWGNGKLSIGDLTDPLATVLAPNGGESLVEGAMTNLTWTASDAYLGVTSVDLDLTRNNGGTWEAIAAGLSNTGSYSWTVTGPTTNNARVRVIARDAAGNMGRDSSDAVFTITTSVGVEPVAGAVAFDLGPVSPSPTRGPARVEFMLPRAASVTLAVHDVRGRRVAQLARGTFAPGRHVIWWDPAAGPGTPAGLYFVRYQTPEGAKVQRVAVLR